MIFDVFLSLKLRILPSSECSRRLVLAMAPKENGFEEIILAHLILAHGQAKHMERFIEPEPFQQINPIRLRLGKVSLLTRHPKRPKSG